VGLCGGQPVLRRDVEGWELYAQECPPGSYTLVAWQEFTGPVEVPVTVKPTAVQAVNVDLAKK